MKLSVIGFCIAAGAAFLIQAGISAPMASAAAAKQCVKANWKSSANPCPVAHKAMHKKVMHAKKKPA
jgi:hypothetical protein